MTGQEEGGLAFPRVVSRNAWLSEIPDRWNIDLVKRLFRFNPKTRVSTTERVLSLTRRGIIERDISGNEGQLAESYEKYPEVKEGDFVLNPMDLVAGWVAKSNLTGKVSSAYYTFHLYEHRRGYSPFFELVLQTYYRERIFDPFGSGLGRMESGGGRWTLGRDVFMNFPIPVPPMDEQKAAVNYITQETSALDRLISKKEQLIERLLERRQALITHLVTKGLDSSVSMKESGVGWLGKVPNSWKVVPISHLVVLNPETLGASTDPSTVFSYIEIGDVSFSGGIEKSTAVSFSDSPSRARRVVRHNDVLVSTVRTYLKAIGRVVSEDLDSWMVASTGFAVLRPKSTMVPNYLEFSVLSNVIVGQIESQSVGVSYPGIDSSKLVRLKIPVPSFEEQSLIAEHLQRQTTQIDNLVKTTKKAIELLKERRQALITQVVTGKIDVRGFVSGNP